MTASTVKHAPGNATIMMTTKKSLATLALAACGLLALAAPSHAAQTAWDYQSVAAKTTNWNESLTLNKFNSALGTLTSVEFSLEGNVLGSIRFESLDAAPATVTSTLQAALTLKSPSNATLISLTPTLSQSTNVGAWDGALDYGGASGRTFKGLSASSGPSYANDNGNLSFYVGPGTFTVNLDALGQSSASGAGNLSTLFSTQASGTVGVRYTYDPAGTPVPEPTSLALLGLGGAFGLAYRRRRHLAANRPASL